MPEEYNALQLALAKCRQVFWVVVCFSVCCNFFMLLTPLYTMQVLDRVIGGGNLSTLLML
jgi:ABC-type protease/lipase transport system fused ATPase/permease subunit